MLTLAFNPSVGMNNEASDLSRINSVEVIKQNQPDETYFGNHTKGTRQEMIDDLDLKIYQEDIVKFFPDPGLFLGSRIFVYRANPITVVEGKKSKIYRTWKTNVADFLAENRIELGDKDKISIDLESNLIKNQKIVITRVSETTITEKSDIDFETIEKDDQNLAYGKTVIDQVGEKGIREKQYFIRREDGEEVSRKLISNKITLEPKNKIILHGKKLNFFVKGKKATFMKKGYVSSDVAAMNGMAGKRLVVRNLSNGKDTEVRITGGGLFHSDSAVVIDLSYESFGALGGNYSSGFLTNIAIAEIEK